jgi:predicted nucleic acid-binding protein
MRTVFADTHYWLALVNPRDQWHKPAKQANLSLGPTLLVTTHEALSKFLTALSGGGPDLRRVAAETVRKIIHNPNCRVLAQSRDSFLRALDRYAARADKTYSLNDCASMNGMDAEGIKEILTNDHHFEQEGYVVLIKA